jgi:hypothetical protein
MRRAPRGIKNMAIRTPRFFLEEKTQTRIQAPRKIKEVPPHHALGKKKTPPIPY